MRVRKLVKLKGVRKAGRVYYEVTIPRWAADAAGIAEGDRAQAYYDRVRDCLVLEAAGFGDLAVRGEGRLKCVLRVALPRDIVRLAGLAAGDELLVSAEPGRVLYTPVIPRVRLKGAWLPAHSRRVVKAAAFIVVKVLGYDEDGLRGLLARWAREKGRREWAPRLELADKEMREFVEDAEDGAEYLPCFFEHVKAYRTPREALVSVGGKEAIFALKAREAGREEREELARQLIRLWRACARGGTLYGSCEVCVLLDKLYP